MNNITVKADKADMGFATSDSPLDKQTEATNRILLAARIVLKDIQTLPELPHFIFQQPQFDGQISRVILESGYLTLWENEQV